MDRKRGRAPRKSAVRQARSARLIGRRAGGADESLRRVLLAGQDVNYRLIRARRQSIGMKVDHSGLAVRAPRWVTIREIELALQERARWVVDMLAEWRGRNRDSLPTQWHQGAPLLFQGRPLTLALCRSRRKAIAADLLHLTVRHPDPGDESEIAAFCRHWLKEQAFSLLAPRVFHFASRLKTKPPAIKLSDARSQWGSCNHRGEIRLNWRLVQLPPRIADYVVAHEVAHLVELNHSARFWALVEALLPGHDQARRELDALTPLLD